MHLCLIFNWGFMLYRMGRRAVTLESLTVLQVGCGKISGLWMTTELWMIKVQIIALHHLTFMFGGIRIYPKKHDWIFFFNLFVCPCTLQAGSMESPFPQMISLGPGFLLRRCTMSTAEGGWFALAKELHLLQELQQRLALVNQAVFYDFIFLYRFWICKS